jgi:hypothetical protein
MIYDAYSCTYCSRITVKTIAVNQILTVNQISVEQPPILAITVDQTAVNLTNAPPGRAGWPKLRTPLIWSITVDQMTVNFDSKRKCEADRSTNLSVILDVNLDRVNIEYVRTRVHHVL